MTLDNLNEEEFRDELRESLFDDDEWAIFMTPDVLDRTRVELVKFASELRGQLTKWAETGERDWKGRTKNLMGRVHSRVTEVNAALKIRNRAETASVDSIEKKWSALAFTLAGALADSDMAFMLDELWVPDARDPITVGRWLALRTEQRRRRAERLELAEVS